MHTLAYLVDQPTNNNHILLYCMRSLKKLGERDELIFKIILVGQSGTGKSCLMNRYVKRQFTSLYQTTIGTEFQSKTITVEDHQTIKLQIWDTAGQESFRSIIKTFFRNAAAVLLVYDITKKKTLEELVEWKEIAKQSAPEHAIFILVGTHLDMQHHRQVDRQAGEKWMTDHFIDFFVETSAKTDLNVSTLFEEIGKRLFCRHVQKKRESTAQHEEKMVKLGEIAEKKDNYCC